MADEAKSGPTSGGSKTWLWMILSLVVVGGFLVWLGMASEPTAVPVVAEDDETTEDVVDGDVPLVEKDSLADNKAAYEGRIVRVEDIEATTELGPAIFWGELGDQANQVPILVRLDSAAAEGWQLRTGTSYNVTGQVSRMSDSAAAAWGEQGEFRGEGEEMQATFTDYFIQASRIRPARGESSRGGANGDADAEADADDSDG